jgi:large subunit ribosomal protein L33
MVLLISISHANLLINYFFKMAAKSKKNLLIKLVSSAGTGYFYVKKRNPKTVTEKLSFKKYDPVVRKHVLFKEHKLSS